MKTIDAQKVISRYRGDAVVVPTMSAHFEWPHVTTKPELDMLFSVFGKASSLALGLALGRPDKKVFVIDGDGSLLSNLGTLVTVVNAAPKNFIYLLLDNGCYRCCPPNYETPGSGTTDFAAIAKGAGFVDVYTCDSEESLENAMPEIVKKAGPIFVWIKCEKIQKLPEQNFIWPPLFVDNFVKALRSS